jgi:ubiquinone/menaquinone biosynthesis C-methylase UbiE
MNTRNIIGHNVTDHFNSIAKDYDTYKQRNLFFYYSTLKNSIKKIVPEGFSVLDYGCGTGETLNFLSPKIGVGYDPSYKMVKIASQKFKENKNLKFVSSVNKIKGNFDYIILADVVEHLADPESEFRQMDRYMDKNTKLVVTFVDNSWNFIPQILEKLNLKMPEGPHKRVSVREIIEIAKKTGFNIIEKPNYFLPIKILVLSHPKKD